ncbi:MAG: cache domain-containing protein [Thermodesulfobacteriota bacterium]
MRSLLKNSSIGTNIFLCHMAILIPIFVIAGVVIHSLFFHALEVAYERELGNATISILNSVRTSGRLSIKYYLKAAAEKSRTAAEHYWGRYQSGEMSAAEAVSHIRDLLLRQKIGETGYLYCVDSHGRAVVHPYSAVEGSSYRNHPFVLQQIQMKEGYLEYEWQNPGESRPRSKALYMTYFEPLDWIISVTAYVSEFSDLIQMDDFRESISQIRLGIHGYVFIVDRLGNLIMPPDVPGQEQFRKELKNRFLEEMIARKEGKIQYEEQDPRHEKIVENVICYQLMPEFGWIVGSTYHLEEMLSPLKSFRRIFIISFILIILASGLISYLLSVSLLDPVNQLVGKLESRIKQKPSDRAAKTAGNEIERLNGFFDQFTAELDAYHRELQQEISERKKTEHNLTLKEDHLLKANKMLQTILDTIPVRVFWKDRTLTYMGCNRLFANDAGIASPEQIVGKTDFQMPWKQEAELYRRDDTQVLKTLEPRLFFEESQTTPDGNKIFLRTSKVPLCDATGAVMGIMGVYEDITSEKQSSMERKKLDMAIEQVAEIIVITDTAGNIEYVNPAFEKLTGYPAAETLGRKPSLLKSGKHDNAFYRQLWETIKNGNTWSGRITNRKKDGSLFEEHAIISPLRDGSGNIINYVAVKRDITREVRLESELQQARKMEAIGTLAGGIAHDFNNILAAILGYTEIAMLLLPDGNDAADKLAHVIQASQRAKDLVNQILTFSRQDELIQQPVEMRLVVKEVLRLLRASIPATIEFRETIARDTGMIMGDPIQIHQIVMNLCTNAYHAMTAEGGTLSIELGPITVERDSVPENLPLEPGDYIRLAVADTGTGIPDEIIDKIFEPYFTTKERGQGTGMGLSVVHGIVKKLGGDIRVTSEFGKGSVFTVWIPKIKEQAETENRMEADVPRGTESVLVVDDEAVLARMLGDMLTLLGYQVTVLTSSHEAHEVFRKHPEHFDLVITDSAMPKMSGERLSRLLKKIRGDIPVILCSGFSNSLSEEQTRETGICKNIKKPIVMREIALAIREVLEKTARERKESIP